MTNGEKYKTVGERNKAFSSFCKAGDNGCKKCQLKAESMDHCSFLWLDLEAEEVEEEKAMPCPFCGGDCRIVHDAEEVFVQCGNDACVYSGGLAITIDEAISAHNRVCKAVAAYNGSEHEEEDCRLITITEACQMLGLAYYSFYRRMKDGCFDVVDASGRAMIRRQSVIEYSKGLRKPTPEALEAREQRNALRRKPKKDIISVSETK